MQDLSEVKKAVLDINNAWQSFKTDNDRMLSTQNEKIDSLQEFYLGLSSPNSSGSKSLSDPEETKAFMSYLRTGRETELQQKSMSTTVDPDGGYLVLPQIETEISKYLRARSPMRRLSRVVPVGSNEYKLPVAVGSPGYGWVGETAARTETTTPGLILVTIPTRELYAMPKLTQVLLDDNDFDLENWLIQEIGEAFGDGESAAFINGDGVLKPRGLFTYATDIAGDASRSVDKFQHVLTGANGGLNGTDPVDALISLVYAVKPQYRANASWLVSPELLETVRKVKNPTTDEYIWQESAQAGQPATLLGYPVEEDENIPAIANGSLSAAFGDFSRVYTITDRNTAMLRDPYTAKPYVQFYTTKRVGGAAGRDFRAVKFLKFSAA